MSATALYRALVDAGAEEHLANEAVESVVYAPEAATRSDLAELREATRSDIAELRDSTRADIAELRMEMAEFKTEVRTDIADFKVDVERGFRGMTWRFVGLLIATQALLFTALRLTGTG